MTALAMAEWRTQTEDDAARLSHATNDKEIFRLSAEHLLGHHIQKGIIRFHILSVNMIQFLFQSFTILDTNLPHLSFSTTAFKRLTTPNVMQIHYLLKHSNTQLRLIPYLLLGSKKINSCIVQMC